MPEKRSFVVVSGAPGSGKTTLARSLSEILGLPLLSKDTVKEALLSTLGADTVEVSKHLGRASLAVLMAVAAESQGAVIESVWRSSLVRPDLAALHGQMVEVFCRCDVDVARARYRARDGRAEGHFDQERLNDNLWHGESAEPIAGGWPVIEVDTSTPVDLQSLVDAVKEQLGPT